jgi:hypothetical protein
MQARFEETSAMPQLHARGVDLVVELLDAADHLTRFTPAETRDLLKEAAMVLGELLKRDIPERRKSATELQDVLDRMAVLPSL